MNPSLSAAIGACIAGAAIMHPAMAARASSPAPAAATSFTAENVNGAGKLQPAPGEADRAAVLRAQVLLDRAHFSSGEIDGAPGSNMRQAIAGYQKKNGLATSAVLDAATWAALNADNADALSSYTITEADVAGPFQSIPEDMAAKAKLSALGYTSAEEALAEKFHASAALLKRLNPGKDLARAGETILAPNVLDSEPLPKAGKIVVAKAARTLTVFDTAGKIIAQYPASTGSDHDPLPIGSWKVEGISKAPVFYYNPKLFWDAEPGEKKAKIPAGPNNPVGVAWIDLSKPHYGIHGTPVPGSIGKTQSHGCIRLTNWDVTALTASVASGTAVVLQR